MFMKMFKEGSRDCIRPAWSWLRTRAAALTGASTMTVIGAMSLTFAGAAPAVWSESPDAVVSMASIAPVPAAAVAQDPGRATHEGNQSSRWSGGVAGDCPPADHNCFETGGPGCNDPECCQLVCDADPFCCDTMWDGLCVDQAEDLCNGCGHPDAGSCCESNGTPFCDDRPCCEMICADDPFCCDTSWDGICAEAAIEQCTVCGGEVCGPACEKTNVECFNPGPVFDNAEFVGQLRGGPGEAGICTAWVIAGPDIMFTNAHCSPQVGDVVAFDFQCDSCDGGSVPGETEFSVTSIVSCNEAQDWCLFRVDGDVASMFGQAQIDPSFADVGTEIYEIHHAEGEVKGYDDGQILDTNVDVNCPGDIAEHSVSVIASQGASGSPVFRVDNNCVTAACNCGPPCDEGFVLPMSTIWANIETAIQNAGGSIQMCGDAPFECPDADHNCFETGGPGCTDPACCEQVCTDDPFCCDTEWDSLCVDQAEDVCDGCGDPSAGNCCKANGTPFCDNRECCDAVCADDPFCCDTEWDSLCADGAAKVSACDCVDDCLGDLDASGEVDGADLALLLGDWGQCDDPGDCPADLDDSGVVDGADLALLLGAWGPCP